MRPTTGILVAIMLGALGCLDCPDTEYRGAESFALTPPSGTRHEQSISVRVSESRDPSFKTVAFTVEGIDLRWHVRGFTLVESGPEGRVLFDFPIDLPPGNGTAAASGDLTDVDPAHGTFDTFVERMMVNAVVAEIITDLPGMEIIRAPLKLKSGSGWQESSCEW